MMGKDYRRFMGLIHRYKNNGYNIVLDVNSGCIHVVDDVVYETVGMLDEGKTPKEIEESLAGQFSQEDIRTALQECEELKENGMLFTEVMYMVAGERFTGRHVSGV